MTKTFAPHKLRSRRREAGYSQAALAQKAGLTRLTITRMEAGKPFRFGNLLKIAQVLDIEITDLISD